MISVSETVLGFLSSGIILREMSRSVMMPTGFLFSVIITLDLSHLIISFAICISESLTSAVITRGDITSRTGLSISISKHLVFLL